MPRYIDAMELRKRIKNLSTNLLDEWSTMGILAVIDKTPTADAIEVVRCKDCEYGEQDEEGRWYCRSFGCQVGDADGNGFCADGERREEDAQDH